MWSWCGFVDSVESVLRKLVLGLFAQQRRPPMLMKCRWNSIFRWIFLLLLCGENRTAIWKKTSEKKMSGNGWERGSQISAVVHTWGFVNWFGIRFFFTTNV